MLAVHDDPERRHCLSDDFEERLSLPENQAKLRRLLGSVERNRCSWAAHRGETLEFVSLLRSWLR